MPKGDFGGKRNTNGLDKNKGNINKKGRPKLLRHVIDELKTKGYEPVTSEHVKSIYETLLNINQEQLADVIKDEKQPMITRIIGKALASGRGFEVIETMIDRAQGKAQQSSKTELTVNTPIIINWSDKD